MTSISHIIDQLAVNSSRNKKIEILEQHKDNEVLKRVLDAALNPYRQYFIKQIPDFTWDGEPGFDIEVFLDHLSDFEHRVVTGNEARSRLSAILSSLSPSTAQLACKIIQKDLKCGVQASTVNKVWKDLIPTYPCLLGKAYDDKTIKAMTFPCFGQLKADGMRANIIADEKGNITIRGRSGKLIDLRGKLEDVFKQTFPYNVVLDGELLVDDGNGHYLPREQGNGILNKAIRGTISEAEADKVVFRAWDLIPLGKFKAKLDTTPYSERLERTRKFVEAYSFTKKIEMIESSEILQNLDEAHEYFELMIARGEEGCMLKSLDHPWEDKRSPNLIKMKAELDCDLVVTGWNPGKPGSKFENQMGSLICESSDGKVSVAISGFSEELRQEITDNMDVWLGKVVTVLYNERIKSKDREDVDSLFLPRFLEKREDKYEADPSEKIK